MRSMRAWSSSRWVHVPLSSGRPMRSSIAPSARSRRWAASATACRISRSSRIALTRAAISRRVRSASAVRARSDRDAASSRMSRALVMAMAAWLARARTRSASVSSKASRSDGVDLDDAERAVVAGDRRGDHRVEAGPLVELGRLGRRREQAVELVAGDDDAVLGHGDAGRALADRDPQLGPLLVGEQAGEPVVERPAQLVGAGLEQVEDGALPADQPTGQLDDLLEDVGRVAQRGDPRGDLAQRLFGLGPAGQSRRASGRARR